MGEHPERVRPRHQSGPVGGVETPQHLADAIFDSLTAQIETGGQLHRGLTTRDTFQYLRVESTEYGFAAGRLLGPAQKDDQTYDFARGLSDGDRGDVGREIPALSVETRHPFPESPATP